MGPFGKQFQEILGNRDRDDFRQPIAIDFILAKQPARLEHSFDFGNDFRQIADVFQYVDADDCIKAAVIIRQHFTRPDIVPDILVKTERSIACRLDCLLRRVDARQRCTPFGQCL